jgi:hypothetical protein
MGDDVVKQAPKFKHLVSAVTEGGDIIQQIKGPKILFNNKKQLFCKEVPND